MLLLTGSTGFLGGELLRRLILSPERPEICLLIRGQDSEERFKRLIAKLVQESGSDEFTSRLRLLSGDTSLENLGLGAAEFESLSRKISRIIHSSASTNLGQSIEAARLENVRGTRELVRLARSSGENFQTFFHVSTAYVAGDTTEKVSADRLILDGPFKNGYEQSKAEAEMLVRESGLDYCIFRPSIIVGDSHTGITSSFNVLYVPVKFLVRGLFSALPLSDKAPFDAVPINYVADSIVSLSGYSLVRADGTVLSPALRSARCYHLASGAGRESSPLEVLELVIQAFNKSKLARYGSLHIPKVISQEMLNLIYHSICVARTGVRNLEKIFTKNLSIFSQALPFLPYMIRNPQFDISATVRDLGDRGLAPLFEHYAERLFLFCFETDWGKNIQSYQPVRA
jgi:thioester reductase-like protein